MIKPSILDISFLQVDQTDGDGSQAHVAELASGWMADNAAPVDAWIAEAVLADPLRGDLGPCLSTVVVAGGGAGDGRSGLAGPGLPPFFEQTGFGATAPKATPTIEPVTSAALQPRRSSR
ncbi:MAG: hypothetical protein CM1200mP26_26470 [Acidimicrobiales bacterium]|nr:MAG: hypothetical protein CM1200mP26_26470 [Acidimicrobiales bacterium]